MTVVVSSHFQKEVLMDYQKTRNYREKEKIEKRAQRKKGS
jgi:hypothetical protein